MVIQTLVRYGRSFSSCETTLACLGSNEQLKNEVERLSRKLAEAEKDVASKRKVEDELASLKSKRDSVVAELQKEIEANTSSIEKYNSDLAASLESNEQLKLETKRLCRKLAVAEKEIASNKAELQKGIDANTSLNEKYKSDLAASLESNEILKIEVERLGRKLVKPEKAVASNKRVKDELASLKGKSDSIVADLHSDIECLVKVNSESVKENEQLKQELKKHAERNKSDVATQRVEKAGESNDDILSGNSSTNPVSAEVEAIGNQKKETGSDSEFESDDMVVKKCRQNLRGLKFG